MGSDVEGAEGIKVHPRLHDLNPGVGETPHLGYLAWSQIDFTGSNITDLDSYAHSELQLTEDDHHAKLHGFNDAAHHSGLLSPSKIFPGPGGASFFLRTNPSLVPAWYYPYPDKQQKMLHASWDGNFNYHGSPSSPFGGEYTFAYFFFPGTDKVGPLANIKFIADRNVISPQSIHFVLYSRNLGYMIAGGGQPLPDTKSLIEINAASIANIDSNPDVWELRYWAAFTGLAGEAWFHAFEVELLQG